MPLTIGRLRESDVDRADAIFRTAFGTFLGVPEPSKTFGDGQLFRTRWSAPNTEVLAAWDDGVLVGTNVLTRWGSVGVFGPLTIDPARWDQGIATLLLQETNRSFERWGVTHRGLFTFPQSAKHLGLYQRFGFWPGALTPVLTRELGPARSTPDPERPHIRFGETGIEAQPTMLAAIRTLGDALYPGLDVSGDILSIQEQRLGETVLQFEGESLTGVALCHIGAGSEAESGNAYLKFGAVVPGGPRVARLDALVRAAEDLARERGATSISTGVNLAHRATYEHLRERGYRAEFVGVAMHAPDGTAYHRPELDVLDDWR